MRNDDDGVTCAQDRCAHECPAPLTDAPLTDVNVLCRQDLGFIQSFEDNYLRSLFVNQYAAMPSHHAMCEFVTALVFCYYVRRSAWWLRLPAYTMIATYLVAQLLLLVVTANHFVLDIIVGFVGFAVAWWLSEFRLHM